MPELPNPFHTLQQLKKNFFYYSLPSLEKEGFNRLQRLPISIRIMLESLLRNFDGKIVKEQDIAQLANWNPKKPAGDIPFVVSRVILQDFTGVPLLRRPRRHAGCLCQKGNLDASQVEPLVPVDLVVDHSVQVDRSGTEDAFLFNLRVEFRAE